MYKKVLCILLLLCFVLTFTGCNFAPTTTYIDNLDEDLITELEEAFDIYISDDIVFIKGHDVNAWQDPHIYLVLKVPNDIIDSFYNTEYYIERGDFPIYSDEDKGFNTALSHEKKGHTHIAFYEKDDQYTTVRFFGTY